MKVVAAARPKDVEEVFEGGRKRKDPNAGEMAVAKARELLASGAAGVGNPTGDDAGAREGCRERAEVDEGTACDPRANQGDDGSGVLRRASEGEDCRVGSGDGEREDGG